MPKPRIGKNLETARPGLFVPEHAELGDPEQVASFYQQLEKEEPGDLSALEQWIARWSELEAAIAEESEIRTIRFYQNTQDKDAEKARGDFIDKVDPVWKNSRARVAGKFLKFPALSKLSRERYRMLIWNIESEEKIFQEANLPLQAEESKLVLEYQKLMGKRMIRFQGSERSPQELDKYLESPDRDLRKKAWEKIAASYLEHRETVDDIFSRLVALRSQIAVNAGFDNYNDYALVMMKRFGYGSRECEDLCRAIEKTVVPVYRKLQEQRRQSLGLDRLRPWDLKMDTAGLEALRPFKDEHELVKGLTQVFSGVDPSIGERFKFMAEHELLDLWTRPGKAQMGLCFWFPLSRLPYIFYNSTGIDFDLTAVLHEFGHALHVFESRGEPLFLLSEFCWEFGEATAIAMELLGMDHLQAFYNPRDAARSRARHLGLLIERFCYLAAGDEFQRWVYRHPGHSPKEREEVWTNLRIKFMGIEDWSGFEEVRKFLWHRVPHYFSIPFYYIDYAIAQAGALQIWKRYREAPESAIRDYRASMALAGTKPLPELFQTVGARLEFSGELMESLMNLVEQEMERVNKIDSP